MNVVAIGRTRMLLDTIQLLHQAGHQIPLVATCRASQRRTAQEQDFAMLAKTVGAEFLSTQSLNSDEAVGLIRAARGEVGVSVDWVNLIGPETCGCLQHGIFNAHGGDLPRYRGNSPVSWAILRGERVVGLTIHQMDPHELDAGPIALKEMYPISEATYVRDVFDFIEARVPPLFLEAITKLASGSLQLTPQRSDEGDILRCYPRIPSDGWLEWGKPARHLSRLVHATAEPFDGAFTEFGGSRLTVWRARAEEWAHPSLAVPGQVTRRDSVSGEVAVATGDGVLVLEEVELGDAGRCRAAGVIRSVRNRLGQAAGPSPRHRDAQ